MSDRRLRALARKAGVAGAWIDERGLPRRVASESLRAILSALGLANATAGDIAESAARLDAGPDARRGEVAPLVTAIVGRPTLLPAGLRQGPAQLLLEAGETVETVLEAGAGDQVWLPAVDIPGYHRLKTARHDFTVAVAPRRCFGVQDLAPGRRPWGLAAQVYGLRRAGDFGIGDLGAAAALAEAAAGEGADALALSPIHAMFSATPGHFSPYSPSSRLFLNPLHADPHASFDAAAIRAAGGIEARDARRLIDWPASAGDKLRLFRALFDRAGDPSDFRRFRADAGRDLERHARFEALHAQRVAADPADHDWRKWPAALRDPAGPGPAAFARREAREIRFHMFLQWLAARSAAAAQARARAAGMRIGLITDLAVGMDPRGSHAWGRQGDLLPGLTVGSPPDPSNPAGQSWGLATFSPRALVATGFAPFLATLRAAFRHAGGIRIDHVMGLMRLWVVPDGAPGCDGAYLSYPFADLLRLVVLESHRARALVIGEDLGTVPRGFRERLRAANLMGMSVLWFERDVRGDFSPPSAWRAGNAGMTSTHDLPTVAGWWRGSDLATRAAVFDAEPAVAAAAAKARAKERRALWRALRKAGAATGEMPASQSPAPVAEAAVRFVARSASRLALIPLEDVMGLAEQPNLPGTTREHPNWRRRMARPAGEMLRTPRARAAIRALRDGRGSGRT